MLGYQPQHPSLPQTLAMTTSTKMIRLSDLIAARDLLETLSDELRPQGRDRALSYFSDCADNCILVERELTVEGS